MPCDSDLLYTQKTWCFHLHVLLLVVGPVARCSHLAKHLLAAPGHRKGLAGQLTTPTTPPGLGDRALERSDRKKAEGGREKSEME